MILDNDGKGTSLRARDDRYELGPGLLTSRMNVLNNDEYRNGARSELSITTVSDPETGDASVMDGEIVYSTTADATGTDTFTYTVSDGTRTDTATVTVITKPADQPTWRAAWSTTTLTEGGSAATLTITQTNSTSTKTAPDIVTIQVGRNEGTAGPDDLEVSRNGTVINAQTMAPTTDHQGGWVYIADDSGIDVKAQNDGIDEEAETLATWVYVEGILAEDGRRDLTITNTASAREATPPEITGVAIEASGGEAGWSAGEKVTVTFEWNETVTVDTSGGGPAVPLTLGTAGERTATYAQGSGGDELEFTYTVTSEDGNQSSVLVAPNALALGGGTIRDSEGTDASLQHNGASRSETPIVRRDELTAEFRNLPKSHDGERFDLELHFSEEVDIGYAAMRDDALEVAGGEATAAGRITRGSNRKWRIRITPSGDEDVTVTLRGQRACRATGAVCTRGDTPRALTNSPSATVAGPPSEPLTASFSGVPGEHTGESFTFGLTFSEDVAGLSYKTLRDAAFSVTNGQITRARRRTKGSNQGWTITVKPDSSGAVTIRLPETTDCDASGAICTADDRGLSHSLSAKVAVAVAISVADARVEEGADAVLAFAVTLDRAASGTLTVDYATSDGTATAGEDYTATSGTLTFEAGESSKTIEVTVLDDSHDEGEETVTLTLSNASGARIADASATGTIENRDPLPRAFMARFGRTAAVHVVEQVQERIEAQREVGIEAQFAGRQLRPGMEREMAVEFLSRLAPSLGANRVGAGVPHPMSVSPVAGSGSLGTPSLGGGAPMGTADELLGGANPMGSMPGTDGGLNQRGHFGRGLGGGNLLTGSAFVMNHETRRGGILSFWSRGAQSRFAGRDGKLSLDGRVRTTMFGADYAKGPLITGLSLSHSRGLGGYSGVSAGEVTSSVTGLYPWLGYKVSDRITLWGVTGYGKGALTLTPGAGTALRSGLSMAMTAGGMRGELADSVVGGFGLAFKADALWVGTGIEGVDGPQGRLAATSAAVTRYRTALEASRGYRFQRGLSLQPSLEVGVRRDGGDAENGVGVDVGGGLIVSDALTGLSADVRVRMLLVHQDRGFRDRGMSVSFSYNPTPSTPLGFTAKLTPSWGGQATSGARALWGRETMAGMAQGGMASGNRLEAELGYGLPVGSRLVGTPRFGIGTSEYGRDYRLGYGLTVLQRGSMNFELGIEGTRRESSRQGVTDHGALARLTARW